MVSLLLAVIYLAFISLGLPDSLLGSAWPMMYPAFGVPVSYAGIVYGIVSAGTVISSLMSDRVTRRFGYGWVTAVSTAMTVAAMLGFSVSTNYWMLLLWAIPYGLGAGSIDACLNNYVALHYASRHMSWLHCMWGVGASIGPYIMSLALTKGLGWENGYRCIGLIQLVVVAVLLLSLPLWKNRSKDALGERSEPLSLLQIFRIPGAREVMLAFFCYCAIEQTAGLWASSYLVLYKGIGEETAARFASLFYIGITAGRFVSGFLTLRFDDKTMIRAGQGIMACGGALMLLPLGDMCALAGLVMIGVGCAPIYPCIIHSTPEHFGEDKSQALIGVQMASAYCGNLLMPPLFGLLANHVGAWLLPIYLLVILCLEAVMHERLLVKCRKEKHLC